ncbi:MotA/TolQ/ExbB proton channel family protein [Puniceibacterium confluentis]|uniref:MotA/TolQ/ExbB proton channel family protein n=1 Tax=Puniceibacterium confluentis TaxID=1958944 RepID=UPI0011B3D4A8|nr:MotA/TolQ/ExbB proton channel family protein [Puniceibacterium confluentis]
MLTDSAQFLDRGGPALWAIGALSVCTMALILWKIWHLLRLGAWRGRHAEQAVALWQIGRRSQAVALLAQRSSLRARTARAAMATLMQRDADTAREECARIARAGLAEARSGLRPLDLIITIAPLLGLLGTVLGMIEAFQALQDSGARADPSALAGGIWEALLTTAAGMSVAIPAALALSWFDSVTDRVAHDFEDIATRLFTAPVPTPAQSVPTGMSPENAPPAPDVP